jgi:signal transduction histidine kinase
MEQQRNRVSCDGHTVDAVEEVLAAVVDRLAEHTAQPDAPTPRVFIGPLPTIRADATMMRQLFDNLIGNSLKYTPPGRPAHLDITVEISLTGELRLVVADRGIGIPEGQHGAVFAGFYRAENGDPYAGTGLGLSICQRIAQRHGGVISAGTNPGGGTRITVVMPAALVSTTTATTAESHPSAARHRHRIDQNRS